MKKKRIIMQWMNSVHEMWIVWMKVKFVNEIIKKLVEVDNMD
jgi:hypothetical protein